jgi:hypothetical protein
LSWSTRTLSFPDIADASPGHGPLLRRVFPHDTFIMWRLCCALK